MYIITRRRMISGEVLKYRKVLFIFAANERGLYGSSLSCLTEPESGTRLVQYSAIHGIAGREVQLRRKSSTGVCAGQGSRRARAVLVRDGTNQGIGIDLPFASRS